MKGKLIYELFTGVGFCNQLFSLETAIYLANISERKLILLIRNPLCHCGQASWNHGDFISLFPNINTLLPFGLEIYKHHIPGKIHELIGQSRTVFERPFSHIAIVDKNIYELFGKDSKYIKNFAGGRDIVIFDINDFKEQHIYISKSNAARCLVTFLTNEDNMRKMVNICNVLSNYKINLPTKELPSEYISIHFRFGDVRYDSSHINSVQNNHNQLLLNNLNILNTTNIPLMIMSDRKDANILDELKKKYKIYFTEDYIDKGKSVIESFLTQKHICEQGKEFIGYYNSTVSHHIHYKRYVTNNDTEMYFVNKRYEKNNDIDKFTWNINGINGPSISWSLFCPDTLMKTNDKKFYITKVSQKLVNKKNKKVISFCLYGINDIRDEKRNFLKGVYVNFELAKTIYPDWICRVYIPISEPMEYVHPLLELENLEVIIVDTNICLRALRFLPYDDTDVDIWISRDLDSVLNVREKVAVDEWMKGDKKLHVMADNHQHGWNIAAGMFGVKNDYTINLKSEVLEISKTFGNNQQKFDNDATILTGTFFKIYHNSHIQHYSGGTKLPNSFPFPEHEPIESRFVGNISDIQKYYLKLGLQNKYCLRNKVKLFNMDLHISVIADIKDIFSKLCSNVEITDWSLSGHTWVFNRTRETPDIINDKTWRKFDLDMIKEFQTKYDDFLSEFDGFIVTHTPVFCLLFEKYNKPIYLVNSCRYIQPFCWNDGKNDAMMNYLNKSLFNMWERKQLIAISNNKADQRFLELGTNIKSCHIPSLCLYTNAKYNPIHKKIVVMGTKRKDLLPVIDNVVYKDDLKGRYSWDELYSYKAIILMPYEASTMSLFEYYSANVPIFTPSLQFLKSLIMKGKYPCIGSRYFQFQHPQCFNEALNGYPGMSFLDFWLDKADFHDNENMPHIIYFDSFEELKNLILNTDYRFVSGNMMKYNIKRKENVFSQHKQLLSDSFKNVSFVCDNIVPPSYGPRSGYGRNQRGIEKYIKQNVNSTTSFLEIGPGGGQWSREIYSIAKHLHCVDIKSAKENHFWNYVPQSDKISYHHVNNNHLTCINDNTIDCVFTYDTFCYLTYNEIKNYMTALKTKCRPGCKLFISYGDIYKFFKNEPHRISNCEKEYNIFNDHDKLKSTMNEYFDAVPVKGKWFWLGIDRFCKLAIQCGFKVIEKDLNIDKTNPLTYLEC